MSLLFTSNFKLSRRADYLICAFAAAAVIYLGHLMLRDEWFGRKLPGSTLYYHGDVPARKNLLQKAVDSGLRFDLFFIGNSTTRSNISPFIFDDALNLPPGKEFASFNLGTSGLYPGGVYFFLKRLWLPLYVPRYVIQSVRLYDLQRGSGRPRNRVMISGLIERLWLSKNPVDRLEASLRSTFPILGYPGLILTVLKKYRKGDMRWATFSRGFTVDSRGYNPRSGMDHFKRRGGKRRNRRYRSVEAAQLQASLKALKDTIDLAQKNGVIYVLANVPEHPIVYSKKNGRKVYREYLRLLKEFADQHGVLFLDPTDGDLKTFGEDRYFNDYQHLSWRGAKLLSKKLATKFSESQYRLHPPKGSR